MGLEDLLKEQQQLNAATTAIRQAFDTQMGEFEATEMKLMQALESIHQQKATKLKEVAAVLDGILKK